MIKRLIDSLKDAAAPAVNEAIAPTPASPQTAQLHAISPTTDDGVDLNVMAANAEAAVEALEIDTTAWLETDLDRMSKAWDTATKSNYEIEAVRALYRVAHDLQGMAGTYGYPAIGRIAGSLCRILGRAQTSEDAALINLHVEACRAAYLESRKDDGGRTLADTLCVSLEEQVQQALTIN